MPKIIHQEESNKHMLKSFHDCKQMLEIEYLKNVGVNEPDHKITTRISLFCRFLKEK